jgi:hypothetical protein
VLPTFEELDRRAKAAYQDVLQDHLPYVRHTHLSPVWKRAVTAVPGIWCWNVDLGDPEYPTQCKREELARAMRAALVRHLDDVDIEVGEPDTDPDFSWYSIGFRLVNSGNEWLSDSYYAKWAMRGRSSLSMMYRMSLGSVASPLWV